MAANIMMLAVLAMFIGGQSTSTFKTKRKNGSVKGEESRTILPLILSKGKEDRTCGESG